ncbi:MAG: type II toxin-antitoxin system RelE/ParE family toxin [Paracoccaceae bacterium]
MAEAVSFRLVPEAARDLQDIWAFSADRWSVEQAEAYIDRLVGVFELLADYPELARRREEFTPPVRIHPAASHLVVYLDRVGGVDILRVLHNQRDLLTFLDG